MNRPKVTENKSKSEQSVPVRLDKWLWAARFYKNRSLAREMIEGGKVQYNGQRSKPGKTVEIGALLTIRQGTDDKQVIVTKLADKRGNATMAAELYTETEQSIKKRQFNAEARKVNALYSPRPDSKPDKKQRRELIRAKHQ
ncbi:ribosome-associated heat shock protein Hsp15 [Neptunicella marina]|uniref:Heat shock protein 15 n=1 Tax=Neptunicella marina TaxID=2125989 RepID=A0A8J6M456_9ALTE|nr:ribosome-associated heat shock protein Hsp15 [Neptunicella marina]MBC3765861.1 ribosome-associated heat shock protein Hsp15 [Neptunicella marina]